MPAGVISWIFPESFFTLPEISSLIRRGRRPLSRYFPYLAYDPEQHVYINKDDRRTIMFVCTPLWREAERVRKQLESLIKEMPEESVLSFHLISWDWIDDVIEEYLRSKQRDELTKEIAHSFASFMKRCTTDGIPQFRGIPLRRFILLTSLTVKESSQEALKNLRDSFQEVLAGCGLMPEPLDAQLLIRILYNLLNGKYENINWDRTKPISSRILNAETEIRFDWRRVRIGKRLWACITPKSLAPEFQPYQVAELIGSSEAMADGRQIPSHFIYSVIIYYTPSLHGSIIKKAGLFFSQIKGEAHKSIIGRLMGEYAQEHSEAASDIERGERFYYIYPVLWLFDRDEKKLNQSIQRAKNLFSSHGFVAQEERGILPVLFLISFPAGFSLREREIFTLDRHFIGKAELASALLPVVADMGSVGKPSCIYFSRKGQIVSFDPWTTPFQNRHCLVAGATGGGKSLNMNLLVYSLYASGAMVRIVDLGYSYQKLCRILKGDYIDFREDSPLCINPFSYVRGSQEEINSSLEAIKELILTMIFTKTREIITKEHEALVKEAVHWVWNSLHNNGSVSEVFEWLAKFPAYASVEEICDLPENATEEQKREIAVRNACLIDLKNEAQKLAYALKSWCEGGPYGRWFNGKASVDLVSSEFLVLELEQLKRNPVLLKVVAQAIITALTASMYASDRGKKKLFLFEECGIILKDNPVLKLTIEEMYRRARKYNGAVITVFQSLMDMKHLGESAHVITGNSSFHFYLPECQIAQAAKEGIITDNTRDLIQLAESVHLNKPHYGEMVLRTPNGYGVVRTVLNGMLYYLVTTDPEDVKRIEAVYEKKKEQMDEEKAFVETLQELGKKRDA